MDHENYPLYEGALYSDVNGGMKCDKCHVCARMVKDWQKLCYRCTLCVSDCWAFGLYGEGSFIQSVHSKRYSMPSSCRYPPHFPLTTATYYVIRLCVQVEDMDKFHFKPKELVSSIVAIYVNLGQSSEFCRALPQDGRSFSIELLEESARIMRSLAYPCKPLC